MTKSNSQRLYETNRKIIKWTVKCEDAMTRKQALKALRKIAKFSKRLARLQGLLYTQENERSNP